LAAGESSRFWPLNYQHKSLLILGGRPLILHALEGLKRAGIREAVVIQGSKKDIERELKNYSAPLRIRYVVQPKPLGTGDALRRAEGLIKGPFVVIGGHKIDLDDYLPRLIKKYAGRIVFVGTRTSTPWEFGIAKFKSGKVVEIVENPAKGKEPSDVKTSETYVFPKEIFGYLKKVPPKEDALIDAMNLFIKEKRADLVLTAKSPISLKYPWNALDALDIFLNSKNFKKKIASSAFIGRNVVIKGRVYIGKNASVGDNSVLTGPCYIGDGCKIGAANVFRGPVSLEKEVTTGAFFEIKNSIVQAGTHFHSGYLGDSVIGKDCRFGAGFITANRRLDRESIKSLVKGKKIDTGITYLGAIVGEKTSFGIHTGTMPGVLIGSNSLVGPGTLIFDNIKDKFIVFSESKTIDKPKD